MKDLPPQAIAEIVNNLEGTSGVFDQRICTVYSLKMEELEQLAEENGLIRCETCGWWVETAETEEGNCENCQE